MPYIQLIPEKIDKLLTEKGWSYNDLSRETEKFGEKLSVSAISSAAEGNQIYPSTGKRIKEQKRLNLLYSKRKI